jgi:hypothetical protein
MKIHPRRLCVICLALALSCALGCMLTIPVPPPGEHAEGGAVSDAGLEDVALAPDVPDAPDARSSGPDASAPADATTTTTGSSGGPIGQGRDLH